MQRALQATAVDNRRAGARGPCTHRRSSHAADAATRSPLAAASSFPVTSQKTSSQTISRSSLFSASVACAPRERAQARRGAEEVRPQCQLAPPGGQTRWVGSQGPHEVAAPRGGCDKRQWLASCEAAVMQGRPCGAAQWPGLKRAPACPGSAARHVVQGHSRRCRESSPAATF